MADLRHLPGCRHLPGGQPEAPAAGGQHVDAACNLHEIMTLGIEPPNWLKLSSLRKSPAGPILSPPCPRNTSFPVLSTLPYSATPRTPTPQSWGSLLSTTDHRRSARQLVLLPTVSYSSTSTQSGLTTTNPYEEVAQILGPFQLED